MKIKILIVAVVVVVFAALSAGVLLARDTKGMTYKGWLVDQLCADAPNSIAADGVDLKVSPELHSLQCALMPPCVASGYGIYVENESGTYDFIKFDKNGSKLAEEYLRNISKENRISVIVTGNRRGDTIRVKTLSEAMM
jgi:hypothetical protein